MKSWIFAMFLAVAPLFGIGSAWAHGDDAHQIVAVMKKQFDRPDAPLVVEPVTIEGVYAVAGWTQTGKGGRAFLEKYHGQWRISVCAGDALIQAKVLETTGMDAPAAQKLAKAIAMAESKLSAEKRRLFASFDGMVKIDASAAPGQHGAHGAANAHGAHAKP